MNFTYSDDAARERLRELAARGQPVQVTYTLTRTGFETADKMVKAEGQIRYPQSLKGDFDGFFVDELDTATGEPTGRSAVVEHRAIKHIYVY